MWKHGSWRTWCVLCCGHSHVCMCLNERAQLKQSCLNPIWFGGSKHGNLPTRLLIHLIGCSTLNKGLMLMPPFSFMLEIVVSNYSVMLWIFGSKKKPSPAWRKKKKLFLNTKITVAAERRPSILLSGNYYASALLWLNSSVLANNEKAIMAKLCSHYALHFVCRHNYCQS